MAVLALILSSKGKTDVGGYMKSPGDRLSGQEKAKQEISEIGEKQIDICFYIGRGIG